MEGRAPRKPFRWGLAHNKPELRASVQLIFYSNVPTPGVSLVVFKHGLPQGRTGLNSVGLSTAGDCRGTKSQGSGTCHPFPGPPRQPPSGVEGYPEASCCLSHHPRGICQLAHWPYLSCPPWGLDRWLSHQLGSPLRQQRYMEALLGCVASPSHIMVAPYLRMAGEVRGLLCEVRAGFLEERKHWATRTQAGMAGKGQ